MGQHQQRQHLRSGGEQSLRVVCEKACQTPHVLRCAQGSWESAAADKAKPGLEEGASQLCLGKGSEWRSAALPVGAGATY